MEPPFQLSWYDQLRFDNLVGHLADPEKQAPLTPEEEARFAKIWGGPGEPQFQLTQADEARFQSLFGGFYEKSPHFDSYGHLVPRELRMRLIVQLEAKAEELRGRIAKKALKDSGSAQAWKIIRDGRFYALAIPNGPSASLENLAELIQLDMDDALGENGWLRDANERKVDIFETNRTYSIPNTIFVDFGPLSLRNYNPLGRIFSTDLYWINYKRAQEEAGKYFSDFFRVVETENVSSFEAEMHLKTPYIYVYIFSGHGGYEGGLKTSDENNVFKPGRYTAYKIHHMTLWACSSLKKSITQDNSMMYSSDKSLWNTNVSSKGWVSGYTEEASVLNADIFERDVLGHARLKRGKRVNPYDFRK